jgi:hypothetical protein
VVRASVERFGTAYMSLEARLTENVPIDGPTYADRFHFKFMHADNGRGLEFDPILVLAHFTQHVRVHRRGPGKVILKPSHHDPLGEIEVVELRGATYFEGDVHPEPQPLATAVYVSDPRAILLGPSARRGIGGWRFRKAQTVEVHLHPRRREGCR